MSMLSSVAPWDLVAEGYSEVTMKMFRHYADEALSLCGINDQCHVLDIACGPGTLTLNAAKKAKAVSAIDFSEAMVDILRKTIDKDAIDNIETFCGDAQQLPYDDNSFDAAFSMFGLMFFPDRMKGYKEIYRTLKPGGKTVISSWAPTTQSPMMMAVFGALKAMNPDMPEPQTDIESLENPDFFRSELIQAGFKNVEVLPVSDSVQIDSVEEFWEDMIKGSAPIAMMKNSMPAEIWQEKNRIALDYLHGMMDKLPATLSADAWFGVGVK
ncbi:MAG: methyltransferase domain-containing protein [Gammaproteobacteria bacterium]|nr:methyltransferase domain-containing protein [Gammaproteobacteria bacterium]